MTIIQGMRTEDYGKIGRVYCRIRRRLHNSGKLFWSVRTGFIRWHQYHVYWKTL